jgi:hypothetical protein
MDLDYDWELVTVSNEQLASLVSGDISPQGKEGHIHPGW